ncbi:MAG: beta-galactosidase family protein [Microterricola sp.]
MSLLATTDAAASVADNAAHPATLGYRDGQFVRDGLPHRVLSGSVHYFRVHPEQWRQRLEAVAALGLNTVDTYIAWNFHQQGAGPADFTGWRDVERFIAIADELGLDVIVRPGPYICAEWSNGGLPAWLTGQPGLHPRSSDERYLAAVAEWFDELIPRLVRLQRSNGGPIVAVQVENEFGSYGDDHGYMRWMRDALVHRGITELLYTADGPTELMLDGGTLPDVLATATFGSRAAQAAALLRSRRSGEPFLCAEFWNGWFDHWGERHHIREADGVESVVRDILGHGGSVSFYMAHGGTNFGLWAGANHDGDVLQPTVTSYDSDAPVSESGTITAKGQMLRRVLGEFTGQPLPTPPAPTPVLGARVLRVEHGSDLLAAVRSVAATAGGRSAPHPLSFEELGIDSGLVFYRAEPILPSGRSLLTIRGLHDRAQLWIDGALLGVLDTESGGRGIPVDGAGERVVLEILVENQGRINYGPLLGQGKGILGGVQIERRLVQGWSSTPLPLEEWDAALLASAAAPASAADLADPVDTAAPGFAVATLDIEEAGDAFIALPGFGKGFVWVNGFLLGRYWEIGPQLTLYLPAPLLLAGQNTITVLELEHRGAVIELRESAVLGPEEEFIETFD